MDYLKKLPNSQRSSLLKKKRGTTQTKSGVIKVPEEKWVGPTIAISFDSSVHTNTGDVPTQQASCQCVMSKNDDYNALRTNKLP